MNKEQEQKEASTNIDFREALSTILKVSASLHGNTISREISEWNLPKTTPLKTKRIIVNEADRWNKINKIRANQLKDAFDVLCGYIKI